jgi:hypothetical protein
MLKKHYLKFITKNSHNISMHICYKNKQITNTYSTKFLRLFTDSSLSRNNHFDQLMSKLSTAGYVIQSVKPFMTQETLKVISFSYGRSIFTYGIIIWGNSS